MNEIRHLGARIAHFTTLGNNELQQGTWHDVALVGEQDAGSSENENEFRRDRT